MENQNSDTQDTQVNQEHKRNVFVDMDGVLVDFSRGVQELTGIPIDQLKDSEMWAAVDAHGKSKFFSELNWMVGGKDLWQFVIKNFLQVKILTALGKSDLVDKQTSQGKRMWIHRNIPSLRDDDIIMVQNKHQKKKYCTDPAFIIIDDTEEVIQEWTRKGGIAIFHRTAVDTISKLRQYV